MMKRVYIAAFAFGFLGAGTAIGAYWLLKPESAATTDARTPVSYVKIPNFGEGGAESFVAASEIATPAVVHIKSVVKSSDSPRRGGGYYEFFGHPFKDFFGDIDPFRPRGGSGSGVIITSEGYIVTNHHVIDGADEIEVTLYDNRNYKAELIGSDPSTDLALLRINEKNLPYLAYGNSDEIRVGEWVLAVGNPFNLNSTVTAGIVSAKGRHIDILHDRYRIESFIQTDAAVNPGNSGGALVNLKGELIGINTAIASNTGSFAGYSFAVPVSIVRKVVEDLKEYGTVQRGFLGVSIRDVTPALAEEENLTVKRGAYVAEVNENSAAQEAGVKKGDVIVKVNGEPVNSSSELQAKIGVKRPGETVTVTVVRKGEEKNFTVRLKNKSGEIGLVKREDDKLMAELGATFVNPSENELQKINVRSGAKVESLTHGKLRSAGVREGFIITKVDKETVKSVDDLMRKLSGRSGAVLIEGYYPDGSPDAYAVIF
ncbi:MAG: Do family serine endopeptidase [Bacteroidia bacterium]|nr:Do family serine endopeptidase [Bacteroidia bacterium]MDW8334000.1 Do family serine endopeptidase [Bacteroidia bacterium]